MSMILTDLSNSTFYTFSSSFDLHTWDDHDFEARTRVLDRFGGHGGKDVADGGIEARKLSVKGEHYAASQAALESWLDALKLALYHNGAAYRFSWQAGEYINVQRCGRFRVKRKSKGLAYRAVEIEIEFICPDPFWYSTTAETSGAVSVSTNPKDIVLANNGNVPSPLRIQLDPSATWASLTVTNTTDNNELCRYADPLFGNGDRVIIDAADGAVTRNGLSTLRYLAGAYLRLLPGNNTIRIAGVTGGTATLSAPRRWL